MYRDDRLATVLRISVAGKAAARIQYRQLIDLLGTLPEGSAGPLVEVGFARLIELAPDISSSERGDMLRDPALRLANPLLVRLLAVDDPAVASAAIANARLDDAQWEALIPDLPVRARGLLRHRRDLGPGPRKLLELLGAHDMVLTGPEPVGAEGTDAIHPPPSPYPPAPRRHQPAEADEIGALVRRIEAFQKARGQTGAARHASSDSPTLPLRELGNRTEHLPRAFDFATNAAGTILWADPAVMPMLYGMTLTEEGNDGPATPDSALVRAMRRRLPVAAGQVRLRGAPPISGEWRVDAVPRFSHESGAFIGYCGRFRRPAPAAAGKRSNPAAERLREMLHELRTPVNAIQGFSEIIQQQVFGPAPHEYRALAASIAADAARILAGFDEVDRMARLETRALEMEAGRIDIVPVLGATLAQLEPVLRSRSAAISLTDDGAPLFVPLSPDDAARLCWRIIATAAAAITPGEELILNAARDETSARLALDLPAGLVDREELFTAAVTVAPQGVSAGMFGPGFTLRLARAEARAIGGDLRQEGEQLVLALPLLTGTGQGNSDRMDSAA